MPDALTAALTIPARFNGPPSSANGGYTCGLVAQLVGADEVTVSLRAPPPLQRPLGVARDGERVELRDGDTVVAEGAPDELLLDVPAAGSPGEGAAACALFDSNGRLLCASRALWIELKPEGPA